jgi:hypothetical protein
MNRQKWHRALITMSPECNRAIFLQTHKNQAFWLREIHMIIINREIHINRINKNLPNNTQLNLQIYNNHSD